MKKLTPYLALTSLAISLFIWLKPQESINTKDETATIKTLLDNWHAAAARADYDGYFGKIAEDGRYIGTDATENWDKTAFAAFSKPYFDKKTVWDFKALERNVYFSKDGKTAWFDEFLDTWMKGCRGSGVLTKEGKEWKIKHYVLSMTVPNEVVDDVLPIKAKYEDKLIEKMRKKK
ncbi:nuclear transport factor 2 family protein [Flavobacterium akiainvivens]|uniref:nuclear transport factor 2 family protein n=1 Tax=Flavobacterium akiainvivens TaxID=1202724 RepID=UPI0006C8325D|nr:nuclear transport factor 2 family protein [Flavobacterium akiainvivens]SFQ72755.1 SnoaL-like domain-containing protein [Flavobacterium akiainvivens]